MSVEDCKRSQYSGEHEKHSGWREEIAASEAEEHERNHEIMLGIPSGTDLNGIADKLGQIVASLGPEESAVVAGAIQQLSDHASALLTQEAAIVKAAEDPILVRLDALTAVVQKFSDFAGGFDISVMPKGASGQSPAA